MQFELQDRVTVVLAKLQAQAMARRMAFDAYLEQFVEPDPGVAAADSLDEFDRVLDEIAALPPCKGALPTDFSRADVYADHD